MNRVKYPGASSNGEMLRREQEAVDGGKETCCSHEITPGDLEQPPLLSELLAAARSVHPCGWVLCGDSVIRTVDYVALDGIFQV